MDAIEQADDSTTMFYDTVTGETDTQYDIHPYTIMEDFVEALPNGAAKRELDILRVLENPCILFGHYV